MNCIDCPDLDRHPGDIQPRARCCRDEHIDRRLSGSPDGWEGAEAARRISDAQPAPNRAERRAQAAKAKGKPS